MLSRVLFHVYVRVFLTCSSFGCEVQEAVLRRFEALDTRRDDSLTVLYLHCLIW